MAFSTGTTDTFFLQGKRILGQPTLSPNTECENKRDFIHLKC